MIIENRPTNASISTMWALKNYPDLNDFFKISKHLGFQKIELNHQIDSEMLSNTNLDHYQFSSIHEPCPANISTKELADRDWLISSHDDDARKHAVDIVKKSIDLANILGASTIVIHCGTIPCKVNYESKLRALFKAGDTQADGYQDIKARFIQYRQGQVIPRLKAVIKSLNELIDYANQFHVKLGLENRYHYLDIPSLDEMGKLLSLADSSQLGFIYDVGHAQSLDRLGFYPHEEWLKQYSSMMIGAHIHDVIGVTDHYAPGLGEIDFKVIAKYLPEDAFRTFEMLPGNTLAQVKHGLNYMVETGCIKYL